MKFRKLLAAVALVGVTSASQTHTFTDSRGRTVKAEVIGFSEGKVTLRRADGQVFETSEALLSERDREYLGGLRAERETTTRALNEAAGRELFRESARPLDRPAGELASQLGLRQESKVAGLRSWRLYAAFASGGPGQAPGSYRLFGAMPYSVALYAAPDETVGQLSAVFANKGDFGSTAGFGEDHFDGGEGAAPASLEEAMERDFKTISSRLTRALGEPAKQRFGEGKSRRTVLRWDWDGAAILLALEEEEFVTLSLVPVGLAESGGKSGKVDDTALKQRLAASVERRDNGDVVIRGIPMVDQGPKGYCVPATFERAMRFMGIDADMYLLAMVGQSSAGGGTSPQLLIDEVKSQVYRKGRRTRDDQAKRLSVSRLKRFLDDGVPVMWTMYSLNAYNQVANGNTEKRAAVTDWDEWAETVAVQSKEFEKRDPTPGNHHICMIIGYNEKTGELAVSDSWGPSYELRWVPEGLAAWVHGGGLFMILP